MKEADSSSDSALLIGHSNMPPAIIKAQGSDREVEVAETDFDPLSLVTPLKNGKASVSFVNY